MPRRRILQFALLTLAIALLPLTVQGQDGCPGNRIANATFEEGSRSTAPLGTRPSSIMANAWNPWSVWGYSPYAQEAEFDVEDITQLGRWSMYRVHSGEHSQKFSTTYGVHNGGMYQRVAVPKGSTVDFSIWVQIYTGEQSFTSNGEPISDLNHPGNYRVYVGIDPYGEEPSGFGAPQSERTVWSEPVIDRDTRRFTEQKVAYDAWVQIKVTAKAQADYVTVYTKGQPEFAVAHNVSYWDDACLTYVPPTPAPTPETQVTPTALPTSTPLPVPTALPTATATEAPRPTFTPEPTQTLAPTAIATATAVPTLTTAPTSAATLTAVPTSPPTRVPPPATDGGGSADNPFLLLLFAALWLSAAGYIGWSLWQRRRAGASQ